MTAKDIFTPDHWVVLVSDFAPRDILNLFTPRIEFAVELFPWPVLPTSKIRISKKGAKISLIILHCSISY
jgi:hypothetical protein